MKYTVIVLLVLAIGLTAYWHLNNDVAEVTNPDATVIAPDSPVTKDDSASSTPDTPSATVAQYKNEQWGFSFEYPIGWEPYENTFRAASSLFNVVIIPSNTNDYLPDPVTINIAPPTWGQTLYERAPEREGYAETAVAGFPGVRYNSTDMSLPNTVYLVQAPGGFWIFIFGKDGYEAELNQVLESFTITPVEKP